MREFERARLLERIERDGATVGADIPERIELDGEEFALSAFVFEMRRRETIPPGDRERVEDAKRSLRRARRERSARIEAGEIDVATGETLAAEIVGIDRALTALEDLSAADIEAEVRASEAADRKRWMRFLRKALGQDDTEGGRPHRTGREP